MTYDTKNLTVKKNHFNSGRPVKFVTLMIVLLAAASSSVPHPVRSFVRSSVTFVKTPIDMIFDNESESFRYY